MSPFDDDTDDMGIRELGDRDVESLLTAHETPGEDRLVAALALVRSVRDCPAPAPSAALAVLLRDGLVLPAPATPPSRARTVTRAAGVAAAVVAALGLTVGAAAADVLPAPVQGSVADVVSRLTPFELPRPTERGLSDDAPDAPAAPGSEGEPSEPSEPDERLDGELEEGKYDGEQTDQVEDPDEPDAQEPDAQEPDAQEPDAEEPDAEEPDAQEPDAEEPDADEPEVDQATAVDDENPEATLTDDVDQDETTGDAYETEDRQPDA